MDSPQWQVRLSVTSGLAWAQPLKLAKVARRRLAAGELDQGACRQGWGKKVGAVRQHYKMSPQR